MFSSHGNGAKKRVRPGAELVILYRLQIRQVQSLTSYKQSLLGTIMLSALRYDTPSSSGEQTFWDEPAQVGREQIKICREEAQQQGLLL